jgi:hypothetical protein
MATKIEVLRGDVPVEGMTLIVGDIAGEALTTNVRGLVTLPALDEGWEGFVDVLIGSGTATATLHIVEGEVHSIDLGVTPD